MLFGFGFYILATCELNLEDWGRDDRKNIPDKKMGIRKYGDLKSLFQLRKTAHLHRRIKGFRVMPLELDCASVRRCQCLSSLYHQHLLVQDEPCGSSAWLCAHGPTGVSKVSHQELIPWSERSLQPDQKYPAREAVRWFKSWGEARSSSTASSTGQLFKQVGEWWP